MIPKNKLRVYDVYKMHHKRKGDAVVKILAIDGEWIDVEIVEGSVQGMGYESYREAGETLRVLESLVTFDNK